jgi:integrating conjugative element protein (TIGR03765 family)
VKRTTTISWCTGSAIALLLVSSAVADLVVLYDSGQSWPIDRYLVPILPPQSDQPDTRQRQLNPQPGPTDLDMLLPVRSPGLSPGPVATRALDAPIAVAFFMIGSDATSLHWLTTHRDYLKRQGAVGLLVDASNEDDLKAVANAARGLPITPASGEDIASALATKHYPFAVTEGRIWQ